MSNSTQRYTKTAIILHWLIGVMIFGMFALGWYMTDLPKDTPSRAYYFNLHKSFGVTILALVLVRIYWRITHIAPALPTTMEEWQKQASYIVHKGLYVLMLAMPLSGVAMSAFSKFGLKWFGIPLFIGVDNHDLRENIVQAHEIISYILLGVVVLHVLAAIKHKLVDKDNIMERMSLLK
jgi:cytochrome b561